MLFLQVLGHKLFNFFYLVDEVLVLLKAHPDVVEHHEHFLLDQPIFVVNIFHGFLFACQLIVHLMQLPQCFIVVVPDLVYV
jgi:hypothetical protein